MFLLICWQEVVMLDQVRMWMEMVSGVAEIPRRQAERLARELARRGEVRASAVQGLAEEIVRRSRENAEMVRTLVSGEILRQIKALGLATREDVDRLARRVRDLEQGAVRSAARPARKPPVKSSAKRASRPRPKGLGAP